jgi:hypothetical protein
MNERLSRGDFLIVLVVVVVLVPGLPAVKKTSTKDRVLVLDALTP